MRSFRKTCLLALPFLQVNYLNGAVVALGERYAVPTPANCAVVRTVQNVEQDAKHFPRVGHVEERFALIEGCIRAKSSSSI